MNKLGDKSYFDKDMLNDVYNQVNKLVISPYRTLKMMKDSNQWDDSTFNNQWKSYLQGNNLPDNLMGFEANYEKFIDGMTDINNRQSFYNQYAPIINQFKINYGNDEVYDVDSFEKFNYLLMPGKIDFKFTADGQWEENDRPLNSQSIAYSFLDSEKQRSYKAHQILDKTYNGGLEKPNWHDDLIKHMSKKQGISGFNINGVPFLDSDEWKELRGLGITPRDYYNWNYRENEENFKNMIFSQDSDEMVEAYRNTSQAQMDEIRANFGDAMYYTLINMPIDRRSNFVNMLHAINQDGLFTTAETVDPQSIDANSAMNVEDLEKITKYVFKLNNESWDESQWDEWRNTKLAEQQKYQSVVANKSSSPKYKKSTKYFYNDGTFNNYRLFVDLGLIKEVDIKKTIGNMIGGELQGIDTSSKSFQECVTSCHVAAPQKQQFMTQGVSNDSLEDGLDFLGKKIPKSVIVSEYGHLFKDVLKQMGNNTTTPRNEREWLAAYDIMYVQIMKEKRKNANMGTNVSEAIMNDVATPELLMMYLKHRDNPIFSSYFDMMGIDDNDKDKANQFLAYMVNSNMGDIDDVSWEQILVGDRRKNIEQNYTTAAQLEGVPESHAISLIDLRAGNQANESHVEKYLKATESPQTVSEQVINQIIQSKIPTFNLQFAEHIAGSVAGNSYLEIDDKGLVTNPGYGTDVIIGGAPKTEAFGYTEPYAPYNTWTNDNQHQFVPKDEVNMINTNVAVVRTDFKGGWEAVSDSRVINTFKEGKELDAVYHYFDDASIEGFASAYNPDQIDAFIDRISLENQGFRLVNLENGELIPRAKDVLRQSYAMSYYWDESRDALWSLMEMNKLQKTTKEQFEEGDGAYSQSDYTLDRLYPAVDNLLSGFTLGLKDLALWGGGFDFSRPTETDELNHIAKALDINADNSNLSAVARRDIEWNNYYQYLYPASEAASHLSGFVGGAKIWTNTINKFWSPSRQSMGGYINSGLMFSTVGTALTLNSVRMPPTC